MVLVVAAGALPGRGWRLGTGLAAVTAIGIGVASLAAGASASALAPLGAVAASGGVSSAYCSACTTLSVGSLGRPSCCCDDRMVPVGGTDIATGDSPLVVGVLHGL